LSSFPVLPRPPAGPHAAETLMPARYHRGHNSPPPGIRSGLTWIAEKTDLSFPWRSAQARDPRHRTAFFGLDIIRHGLGDSEDRSGVSEFSKCQVELEDSATRQVLSTSARLEPLSDRGLKSVSCAFPAALLKRQNYLVQLSGIRANGKSELVTTNAFRAVVK
jgi:hypothetical protein